MPQEWLYFMEGPLLEWVFYLLGIGIGIRCVVYLMNLVACQVPDMRHLSLKNLGKLFYLVVSLLIPYHRAIFKQPFYAILRYIFHACLFIVPIWYSGHLYMLSESSLGWYWEPISDEYIEAGTLIIIWIGSFFLVRRLLFPKIRKQSSLWDFIIIMITIFPYITGYCYVNGTLDHIGFFEDYMWYLHVFTGELMMVMAVFLFVRTRLDTSRCVGCASCTLSCPTGTLQSRENGGEREFFYSHYQCICCGACAATCPEGAAALRHKISIPHFLAFWRKKKINQVELNRCEGCNALFAPNLQLEKISKILYEKGIEPETLSYCNRCKKLFSSQKTDISRA